MTEHSTRTRYYHFIAGVLQSQQGDPLCSQCRAFTNSIRAVRESIEEFERSTALLKDEEISVIASAKSALSSLVSIPDAPGQKKAGNCRLPEGVCFVKSSKKLLDLIQGA